MHICVIGAGVIGVTSAYLLARSGHTVTLLDALQGPARLTSEANGGQLSYSYVAPLAGPGVLSSMPGWLLHQDSPLRFHPRLDPHQWRWLLAFMKACTATHSARTTAEMLTLSYLSRDILHDWMNEDPFDFNLRKNGKLIVYRDAAQVESARQQVSQQAALGSHQSILSRDEVLALEPALQGMAHAIAGAIFTPDEEAGDCNLFTQALFQRLQAMPGVSCLMNTTVNHLQREGGRIVAARTSNGSVQADAYVVANGMGSRDLLRPLGLNPLIYGLKGYSLTVPLHGQRHTSPDISVTDYQRRIVYARLGDTLRIAAMVDIGDETIALRPDRLDGLKRQVMDTFPALDLSGATPWAGLRPATPQSKPIISACPQADNLWLNVGHGALGFTLACGSAALLTALINRQPTPIDPTPFQ